MGSRNLMRNRFTENVSNRVTIQHIADDPRRVGGLLQETREYIRASLAVPFLAQTRLPQTPSPP